MDIVAKYFYRVQEDIIPKILFDYVMFEYLDKAIIDKSFRI